MNRKPTSYVLAALWCLPVPAFMKTIAISLVSSVCVVAALAWPQTSRAQSVPLVFQTTFNCPDWDQTMGLLDADVCVTGDGISGHGSWTTSLGSNDQITAAANNPGGGGGKGFRHWRGDGSNNTGGALRIGLPVPVTEMWVRFYMRFKSGFAWTGGHPSYTKENYWGECGLGCVIFGIQGASSWGVNYNGSTNYSSSLTWAASQGGNTGDGQWHAYEYHLKQNGAAGTIEIWFDGVRYLNQTNAILGSTPWQSFTLGSNQSTVTGCIPDCYTDYDDIAISTTGRIGPIGTPGPGPGPVAPTNLRVQ